MLRWRLSNLRRRRSPCIVPEPASEPGRSGLHGYDCVCALCGWTDLLPTYSLARPYTAEPWLARLRAS